MAKSGNQAVFDHERCLLLWWKGRNFSSPHLNPYQSVSFTSCSLNSLCPQKVGFAVHHLLCRLLEEPQGFRGSSLNQLEHFSFHPFKLFLKTHTEEKNGTVFRASILPEQLRHWILSFCVIPPPPAALRGARSGSQYAHIPQPPFQAQRSSMRRLCPLAGIAALVSCRNLPQLFLFRPCAIFRKQLLSFRPSLR